MEKRIITIITIIVKRVEKKKVRVYQRERASERVSKSARKRQKSAQRGRGGEGEESRERQS